MRDFPKPELAHAEHDSTGEVWSAPHAVVRGADGRSRWVARCPRCAERHEETVVSGEEDDARGSCPACGAIVEIRASGTYRVAPIASRSPG